MSMELKRSKWIYARWLFLRMSMVLFDIIAVNASFFLALVMRFYVANEFHELAGKYLDAFVVFAPYYTVFCLIIFAVCKLYSGLWKYAGLNDMNRILSANIICAGFQVLGTLLFVCRMPITYYCIGSVLQFCLIAGSRFSARIISFEAKKIAKARSGANLNAMIVGSGETARMLKSQLDRGNVAHPACVLNYKDNSMGTMLDGVQVLNGLKHLESSLNRYKIDIVMIADSLMPEQIRKAIRETCETAGVEVQDFSGYFQNDMGCISLRTIAQYCDGEVELVVDGARKSFPDAEQALLNTSGSYAVESISAKAGKLVVVLKANRLVRNDLNASWIKDQEKETGEEISFF